MRWIGGVLYGVFALVVAGVIALALWAPEPDSSAVLAGGALQGDPAPQDATGAGQDTVALARPDRIPDGPVPPQVYLPPPLPVPAQTPSTPTSPAQALPDPTAPLPLAEDELPTIRRDAPITPYRLTELPPDYAALLTLDSSTGEAWVMEEPLPDDEIRLSPSPVAAPPPAPEPVPQVVQDPAPSPIPGSSAPEQLTAVPPNPASVDAIPAPAPLLKPAPSPGWVEGRADQVAPPEPANTPLAATPAVMRGPIGPGAWQRAALRVPPVNGPAVAVVIDDLGLDRRRTLGIEALPGPLSLAYLAHAPDLAAQAARGRAAGHEILLHMPMEPTNPRIDPGPQALRVGLEPDEIGRRVDAALDRIGPVVAMNNHMGSRFTRDAASMAAVMTVLQRRGIMWLDSVTS
ncbi:MAG: divergent polysaccharide deacetylase family protein, partial [Rhodospirillaceae bacterium]